jgi:sugar lactone lactonase YvrE
VCSFILGACRLKRLGNLPETLRENSGLVIHPNGHWYWHNDSGDGPYLYETDAKGRLRRRLEVQKAKHVDWEDMTIDEQGRLYVGDIGNNGNGRRDLCVYRLSVPDSSSVLQAEQISFYYPEQGNFPPGPCCRHYDAEAMFYWKDSLYILTKNRTKPQTGWTYLYRLPAIPGAWAAERIDSFRTGQRHWIFSVTGASIRRDGRYWAMVSANRLWIFEPQGGRFFGGRCWKYRLPWSQKEAIDFGADGMLYLGSERSRLGRARRYRFRWKK